MVKKKELAKLGAYEHGVMRMIKSRSKEWLLLNHKKAYELLRSHKVIE